jgi:hypothetical protein
MVEFNGQPRTAASGTITLDLAESCGLIRGNKHQRGWWKGRPPKLRW